MGVLVFIVYGKDFADKITSDVFKLTYQFLLIGVLGGAVSFVYREFQRERAARDEERLRESERRITELSQLQEISTELISAYNGAKKIRRLLLAQAIRGRRGEPTQTVLAQPYEEQLQRLAMFN